MKPASQSSRDTAYLAVPQGKLRISSILSSQQCHELEGQGCFFLLKRGDQHSASDSSHALQGEGSAQKRIQSSVPSLRLSGLPPLCLFESTMWGLPVRAVPTTPHSSSPPPSPPPPPISTSSHLLLLSTPHPPIPPALSLPLKVPCRAGDPSLAPQLLAHLLGFSMLSGASIFGMPMNARIFHWVL